VLIGGLNGRCLLGNQHLAGRHGNAGEARASRL
jgi:hypothetical protein